MNNINIGIQILAYNCKTTFEQLIAPWVKLKEKYNIKIWVGSGQFKIYNEMGCEDLNEPTVELLQKLLQENKIDYLFQPDPNNLLSDHETRDKCIPWLRENNIDLMVQVDADEFYGDQAEPYLNWILNNQQPDCYNTVLKGVIEEGVYEDWERFSAGWIKRHGGIKEYYLDMHWSWFGKEPGKNVEYRWANTVTVPKEVCNPLHFTWNEKLTTTGPNTLKEKIEYQKRYYENNECDYIWNPEISDVVKIKKELNESEKPILIILAGRRYFYLQRTLSTLAEHLSNLKEIFKEVWLLDDRSSLGERVLTEELLRKYFADNFQTVNFNNNKELKFIDKFNFIKKILPKDEIAFILEDDWTLNQYLDITRFTQILRNSNWTQIGFSESLHIQNQDIKDNHTLTPEFWENPYPKIFKHIHRVQDGIFYWNEVRIDNYTNNPSLVKGEVYHAADFQYIKEYEFEFAKSINSKGVYHLANFFHHIGEISLMSKVMDL